jgi:hypothetical protein
MWYTGGVGHIRPPEQTLDLGDEVVLAVNTMRGHPGGSFAEVRQRGAFIYETKAGLGGLGETIGESP